MTGQGPFLIDLIHLELCPPSAAQRRLALNNHHAVVPSIRCGLRRPPPGSFQPPVILKAEYFDLQRAAAFDHFLLALSTEPPQGQIPSWTGA
jgi:hypothetical protein